MSLDGTDVAAEPSMGSDISPCLRATRVCALLVLLLFWAGAARAATLTLTWNASPETDIAGYTLYWGTQSGVYNVGSVDVGNRTSWQVTGLVDGSPYYFVVRAYDTSNLLSAASTEVSRRAGIPISVAGDFEGAGKSDMTVFRPS